MEALAGRILTALALALAAGCQGTGGEPPADEPPATVETAAPARVLTEEDDGALVVLRPGGQVVLRLSGAWIWSEPELAGDAVELVPVAYELDPGYREWEVVAVRPGTAEVTAAGEPGCADTTVCPPRSLRLRFTVES